MDSKIVTKEINEKIRPLLKENGFNKYSNRTYWRYNQRNIDILNFQSFNSYNASVMQCTTYSFSVNLATYLNYIPSEIELKQTNGFKRPYEYQGHFRARITKKLVQNECQIEDIWFIDEEGKNLEQVIIDCKIQIEKKAFSWYARFQSCHKVLEILQTQEIDMKNTWGFGNPDSPLRNKLIAYTALELGNKKLAVNTLKKQLDKYEHQYEETNHKYYLEEIEETKNELLKLKNYT